MSRFARDVSKSWMMADASKQVRLNHDEGDNTGVVGVRVAEIEFLATVAPPDERRWRGKWIATKKSIAQI